MNAYGFVLWVRLGQIRDKWGGTRRDKPGQNKKNWDKSGTVSPEKRIKKANPEIGSFL